jgi:hypothetical protein
VLNGPEKNTIPLRERPIGVFAHPGSQREPRGPIIKLRFQVSCSLKSGRNLGGAQMTALGCRFPWQRLGKDGQRGCPLAPRPQNAVLSSAERAPAAELQPAGGVGAL